LAKNQLFDQTFGKINFKEIFFCFYKYLINNKICFFTKQTFSKILSFCEINFRLAQQNLTNMTAKEIVLGLPSRFKADAAGGDSGVFHFRLEGDGGGEFTVAVANGSCTASEGLEGEADCVISAAASDFEDAELGRVNKQMAVMMGKIRISNLGAMMKFLSMFSDIEA
jgi:putative sterol carrier protein